MGKPAFDPSKPYEVVGETKKPPFDPSKPYESLEESHLSLDGPPSLLSRMGSGLAEGLVKVGQTVDSYTGAPTRAAIGAYQEDKSPLSAFASQLGGDPSKAPTGKQIAINAGADDSMPIFSLKQGDALRALGPLGKIASGFLPQEADQRAMEPTAADAAGLGVDVGADWTNLLPMVTAAKGAGKFAAGTARLAGEHVVSPLAKLTASGIRTLPGGSPALKAMSVAAEAPGAVKGALEKILKPTQHADFPEMLAIAEKNGIDPSLLPESIEFGPASFESRAMRNVREGTIGANDLEKFNQGFDAVQSATDKKITQIAGGPPPTAIEAGGLIRQGYDDAVERLFENVDFTYNEVIKQAPGIRLTPEGAAAVSSKLAGLEKHAQGLLKRGITNTERGQAEQILRAVEAVRAGNGSLKQTYEAMSQIGRHAFKKGANSLADVPVDVKKFQDLYFTLRDEFINSTAAQLGPDLANALIDSNHQITMFNSNKKYIADLIGKDSLADERLFNSLVLSGDSKKIGALKEILSPEQVQKLKGSVLENLIKRDPDGAFNFRTLHSAMRNKKSVLESLFSSDEISQFGELVKLGDRFGHSVLSTSGTGASNSFRNLLTGIGDGTLTRAVVEARKESARMPRALETPAGIRAAPLLPPGPSGSGGIPRIAPQRNKAEETAKLLQVLGVVQGSRNKEQDAATKRRLEEIIHKRLGR